MIYISKNKSRSLCWDLKLLLWVFMLYTVVVSSESLALAPGVVDLIGPADGAVSDGGLPVLSWSEPTNGAEWYNIWVNRDGKAYFTDWMQSRSWTAKNAMPSGQYKWWVRAWNPDGMGQWSQALNFSIPSVLPGVVGLSQPDNGAVLSDRKPSLSWTSAEPAASWYHLWINRNGSRYHSCWINKESWDPAVELPAGEYKWWVRTWNENGMGPWSKSASFIIPAVTPGRVTLFDPSGVAILDRKPEFSWSESNPSASWYQVWINRDGTKFKSIWTQERTWSPASNMPSGIYKWWVRTWNPDGMGLWSEQAGFQIKGTWHASGILDPQYALSISVGQDGEVYDCNFKYISQDEPAWFIELDSSVFYMRIFDPNPLKDENSFFISFKEVYWGDPAPFADTYGEAVCNIYGTFQFDGSIRGNWEIVYHFTPPGPYKFGMDSGNFTAW